ncbi:RidA family protein [Kineosporia succinea]|uniref:Enamine deaminase RidA (YjgF/YER057c/UK114 family) n=1 Tax=Kineosporia succinea TaxID=84632 RepID=A0ABT9PCX6_9ACTN|nr:RidA family protein [Kineosporia succinea]MDP9829820.1 enamine deaminase RidA (YjgF/YER057c/UK114 family) [Kineosporia succinea]
MSTADQTPENRLAAAGIDLPAPVKPLANYVPATRTGNLVYTAGQLPLANGTLLAEGKVGAGVTPEQAHAAARQAAVNALAAVKGEIGELSRVVRVVKVVVFVASAPDFTAQPAVADGASSLLDVAFGEAGRHSRSAVGVCVLPRDAAVEVEIIVEVAS